MMFLILALSWLDLNNGNRLDYVDITPLSQECLRLTPDSLLVQQRTEILEFNRNGGLIKTFRVKQGFSIDNFAYLRTLDLVVLVTSNKENRSNREIRIYDRNDGVTYMRGYADFKPDRDYFRQLLETKSGRLFVNKWHRPNKYQDSALLVEVELMPQGDGLAFKESGASFHFQRKDAETSHTTFMLRYIANYGEDLVVVNETQRALWTYTHAQVGKRDFIEEAHLLKLNNWTPALKSRPKYEGKTKEYQQKYRAWKFSFSKNVGVWEMDKGLLLAYTSPNKAHSDYGGISGDNTSRFRLHLELVDGAGNLLSDSTIEPMPGTFIAGATGDEVFIVSQSGDTYYQTTIPIIRH